MAFEITSIDQLSAGDSPSGAGTVYVQYDLDANATISLEFKDASDLWHTCTYLDSDFGTVALGSRGVYWKTPANDFDGRDASTRIRVVKIT